jgi:formylglycine-generating enzyme required for sulfatase activity
MKTTATLKMAAGCLTGILAFGALAADPVISDVVARQRWPWNRLVDIDYVLTCDPTETMDIAVTAKDGSVTLDLPAGSLSGDLYGVAPGPRRIIFDPTKTAYTNSQMLTRFSVTLTPAPVPLYMIVDLTKEAGAEGQIEYVYEADLRAGTWGSWEEDPVTDRGTVVKSVVWTGVTTNEIYKTDKLVLRRIPAGSFGMGDSVNTPVTLTKELYAGVFQVTQRQWEWVMGAGSKPSYFNNAASYASRPLENRSYNEIRGASNSLPSSVNWPATGTAVSPESFMGKLRARTGLDDFDLPTEAQWEYLCRAGTTTVFNDGNADARYDGILARNNGNTNDYLEVLGRYKFNGGYYEGGFTPPVQGVGPTNGTATVGSYLPNAWGLYDMHGNVWEWCLDWYVGWLGTVAVTDPLGPESTSDSLRVLRGGSWLNLASVCRSAFRNSNVPSTRSNNVGFRLVRTLP